MLPELESNEEQQQRNIFRSVISFVGSLLLFLCAGGLCLFGAYDFIHERYDKSACEFIVGLIFIITTQRHFLPETKSK